ncbi:MAG: FCD domain-containing protein [Candidatus Dormiibacterota bacterium]
MTAAGPARLASLLAVRIWSGELAAGTRLEPERQLARTLRASRPTVRAALHRLEAAGLLQVLRGRAGGAVVLDAVVAPSLLRPDPEDDGHDVATLLEARRTLEPAVACLAAERATAADLALLQRAVAEQRRIAGWETDLQRDARFHLLLARATHNSVVERTMRDLHVDLYRRRYGLLRAPHSTALVAEIHARTLAAVESGDPARIERDLREHCGWLERAYAGGRARRERVADVATSG